LLGAFMHALKRRRTGAQWPQVVRGFYACAKRRRTASGAIQYESISNIKSSSKM